MRHLLSAALSVLVFSFLTSLLLIPGSSAAVAATGSGSDSIEHLSRAEMAGVWGGGLFGHVDCTNAVNAVGEVLEVVGFIFRDGITRGVGHFLRRVKNVTCEF